MIKQLTGIILMGLFSFLFGCKNNDSNAHRQTILNLKTLLHELTPKKVGVTFF